MFTIPRSAVNAQVAGAQSEFKFATGLYSGTLETFDYKDLPRAANGSPFAGYATTVGNRLTIRLGDIEPLEETSSSKDAIGNRKYFVDIVLSDGDLTIDTVDVNERDAAHWQLQGSAKIVATLAQALGETEEVGEDVAITDGFLGALQNGAYAGTRIGFKLVQNARGYVNFQYFTPV